MSPDTREQEKSMSAAYAELKDQARTLAENHAGSLQKDLAKAQEDNKATAAAREPPVDRDDDIARIERRMEARRASFKQHLVEARGSVGRSAKSWPIVALGGVAAALAIGYAIARHSTSPTQRFAQRAREAPEAARRYIHRATRPTSAVWTERATKAAGVAVAFARLMPQLRALAAALPTRRRPR